MACFVGGPNYLSPSFPPPKSLKLDRKTLNPSQSKTSAANWKQKIETRIAASFSGNSCSISHPVPIFPSRPKISGDFLAGAWFLLSILSALVWILKSWNKRRFTLPQRAILGNSTKVKDDIRRRNLYKSRAFRKHSRPPFLLPKAGNSTVEWRLSVDSLPSVRAAYDCPAVVVDPVILGFMKSTDVSEIQFLGNGIDNARSDNLMFGELALVSGEKMGDGSLIDIKPERIDFCDEEEGFTDSDSSTPGRTQLLLPSSFDSSTETSPSELISVAEQETLVAQGELQAAIPAVAIVAGVFGALTAGVDGGLEMVGFVAATSFIVCDLLWASSRMKLWADLKQVTDREKFTCFLKSRKIMISV